MKTIGIVGGIGPESTIDYYRKIVSAYCEYDINGNYPKIIINSKGFIPAVYQHLSFKV